MSDFHCFPPGLFEFFDELRATTPRTSDTPTNSGGNTTSLGGFSTSFGETGMVLTKC